MNKLSEELNREAIAKIIDPWGWDPGVARAWGEDTCEIHAKAALEKADAIIAMIARSEALSSPGVGGGKGEEEEAQGCGTDRAVSFAAANHEAEVPAVEAVSRAGRDALSVEAKLTHADACRLSRFFNEHADLRTDQDRRINDFLKALIVRRGFGQ